MNVKACIFSMALLLISYGGRGVYDVRDMYTSSEMGKQDSRMIRALLIIIYRIPNNY